MTDDKATWTAVYITRRELIANGELIEAPEHLIRNAGFTVPVAMTRAAYEDAVQWTQDDGIQDETGRWWDVLWMASLVAKGSRDMGSPRVYKIMRVPNRPEAWKATTTRLVLSMGPGDAGEPVITITTPQEAA